LIFDKKLIAFCSAIPVLTNVIENAMRSVIRFDPFISLLHEKRENFSNYILPSIMNLLEIQQTLETFLVRKLLGLMMIMELI
jgi:hypothetical protein